MARPIPTPVFHFTRVEHLDTIVAQGVACDRQAQANGLLRIEVGNAGIKARRAQRLVPESPKGVVSDYVPFYFAPRSPMMYSIHRGNVPGYTEGTGRLVYLVTTLEALLEAGLDPILTDRNAVLQFASFHQLRMGEPVDDFIDWPLMKQPMWNNTDSDPDRMERRMAECLVHGAVPWSAIQYVGAKSDAVADEIRARLGDESERVRIEVRRTWYF